MCLGAIVMGNIKHLSCGAHDRWCGALHLLDTHPYMRSQRIQLADFHDNIEFFQLVLSSYYELKNYHKNGNMSVVDCFRISSSHAVETAEKLYMRRELDRLAQAGRPCYEVYNMITELQEEYNV